MRRHNALSTGYQGHVWVGGGQSFTPAATSVTVTPSTLSVTTQTVAATIAETFTKADGTPLGADLTWTRHVYLTAFQWATVSNRGIFSVTSPGTFRDLQLPSPNLNGTNLRASFEVHQLNRSGTGNYEINAGLTLRTTLTSGGSDYQGYLVEIGRNNTTFPGIDIWSLFLYRINGIASATLLASTGDVATNITLPGTLEFTAIGSNLIATFMHGGTGADLTVSTIDTQFTGGGVGLIGHHLISGTDTGNIVIDNFAAALTTVPIEPVATTITATPGTVTLTTGAGGAQPITPETTTVTVDAGTLEVTVGADQLITPEPVTVNIIPGGVTVSRIAIPGPITTSLIAGKVYVRLSPQGPYDPASGPWYDVTDYVRANSGISIRRGRSDEFAHFQAGTCNFELNNNAREFDPTNTSSPFAPVLRPRTQVEVYTEFNDVIYTMFTGVIENWPQTWSKTTGVSSVSAVDAMGVLATDSVDQSRSVFILDSPFWGTLDTQHNALGGGFGQQLAGDRIASLLQFGGFSTNLNLDAGLALLHEGEPEGNLLSAAQEAENAEAGFLFVTKDGEWEFRDRHARFNHPRMTTVQETFTDSDYGNVDLEFSTTEIINDARVTRTTPSETRDSETGIDTENPEVEPIPVPAAAPEPVTQIVFDDASIRRYGRHVQRLELPVVSDGEAQARAQFLVDRYSKPRQRPGAIIIKPRRDLPRLLPALLGLELLDQVKITRQPRFGTSPVGTEMAFIGQLEQVNHTITNDDWTTTLAVSLPDVDPVNLPLRLDDPEFGKLDLYKAAY